MLIKNSHNGHQRPSNAFKMELDEFKTRNLKPEIRNEDALSPEELAEI